MRGDLLRKLGESSEWRRESLADGWLGMDLYVNKSTGQKVVNVRNVYGDELLEVLQPLYDHGARRFTYMGTAGALDPRFAVGDILVPSWVRTESGQWIPMNNKVEPVLAKLPASARVWKGIRHGHVQSIMDETNSMLEALEKTGVQSIDMETKYFAEFFRDKPEAETQYFLVISDQPRGDVHLTDFNLERLKIANSIRSFGVPILEQVPPALFPGCWSRFEKLAPSMHEALPSY